MRHSMRGAAAAVLAAVMCVTAPLSVFADEIIGPGANLGPLLLLQRLPPLLRP